MRWLKSSMAFTNAVLIGAINADEAKVAPR